MKDFLLWIVAGLVLIALFADGGLTFSPDLSPALTAQLDLNYAPDQSSTTIEQQTNIDTNIERQQTTIIYQGAASAPTNNSPGVHLVDAGPGRCAMQAGDVLEQEQGNGACFVWNGNHKFFINPNGNRWEVDSTGQTPPPTATGNPLGAVASTTIVTTSPASAPSGGNPLGADAAVLLAPTVPRTLIEFQAAFLRNGGTLPWLWNLRGDDFKIKWLSQQAETWR